MATSRIKGLIILLGFLGTFLISLPVNAMWCSTHQGMHHNCQADSWQGIGYNWLVLFGSGTFYPGFGYSWTLYTCGQPDGLNTIEVSYWESGNLELEWGSVQCALST